MRGPGGNGAILAKAVKELRQNWEATERSWRDRARSEFDKDVIQEIVSLSINASNGIQQIEELLRRVQKEVGQV